MIVLVALALVGLAAALLLRQPEQQPNAPAERTAIDGIGAAVEQI